MLIAEFYKWKSLVFSIKIHLLLLEICVLVT